MILLQFNHIKIVPFYIKKLCLGGGHDTSISEIDFHIANQIGFLMNFNITNFNKKMTATPKLPRNGLAPVMSLILTK